MHKFLSMKSIVLFGLTAFNFFLISCNKDSVSANDTNSTILGKWNILNDLRLIGVGINNHPVSYTGQTGDYFDFRTDSNIYIKEGAILDTLSYRLISDTTILIVSFGNMVNGISEISRITNLSAHGVTINAPVVITPGGQFGRTVNLIR